MRKRLISLLLAISLCFIYIPVNVYAADHSVGSATELSALFPLSDESHTITLTADISDDALVLDLSSVSDMDSTITIILNGFDLTVGTVTIPTAGLTISGGGTFTASSIIHEGATLSTLTLTNVNVNCKGDFTWISNVANSLTASTLTIGGTTLIDRAMAVSSPDFSLDDTSKIVIEKPELVKATQDSYAANVATFYDNHVSDHIRVEASGDSIVFANVLPDESEETPNKIVLKNSFTAAVTDTVDTALRVYNGEEQSVVNISSEEGEVWYTENNGTNWTKNVPMLTDAGTISNQCGYMVAGDAEHGNSTPVTDLTFGISPLDVDVTIIGHTNVATYDGTAKNVTGFDVEANSPLFNTAVGTDFAYTGADTTITQTDAGEYDMNMVVGDFSSLNTNFNPTFTVTNGSLQINRRNVTLTSESATKKYDKTALTKEEVTVGGDGWASGEGATYSDFASVTAVGSMDNTFTYTLNAGTTAGNYNITQEYGVLTVTDATPVTVKADNITTKYGEMESGFTYRIYDASDADVTSDVESALEAIGEEIRINRDAGNDAGDYEISFVSDTEMAGYSFTYVNGTYTVEPRNVTLTSGSTARKYNGIALTNEEVTVSGDGWASGEGATYSGFASITDVGSTENTFTYELNAGTSAANYNITQAYGTLTVTELDPAAWTAEPSGKTGLIYNGAEQELVTAGTVPDGCTAQYSTDGTTWSDEIPTGKNAGDYSVYYRIAGDGLNYADSVESGPLSVTIEKASATVTGRSFNVTAGETAPAPDETYCTVEGVYGNDELGTVTVEYRDGSDTMVAAADVDTASAGTTYRVVPVITGINDNYSVILSEGTLTVAAAGGSGKSSEVPAVNEASYDFTQPEEGVGAGVEDETAWTWGERANLAEDTATIYMILSNNSVSEEEEAELPYPEIGTEHFLTKEEVWELPATDHVHKTHDVEEVLVCQADEPVYTANGDGKTDESSLNSTDFYVVGSGAGDTRIDYAALTTGDVVKNTTFNGVYITKLQKTGNPNFDSDLARIKDDVIASFRAFEFDHPEVFWLTDSVKVRAVTVTMNGVQTAYVFIVLVDDSGFCMRMDDYAAPGAIEAAIRQRDAAADAIIAQIPQGASTRDIIANLNKWFTLHNEYNRSADLNSIGYAPHRSLKALVGGEGTNGPVCDGYSRAFKMICDRIGIPVILDTGVASRGSHSEMHMWMRIQVDGVWYGMDCTWDDPVVDGVSGIISGFENEKYMLVGDDTVVDGQKFGISHPTNKTVGGTTGVLFASLMVNVDEIEGYAAMPFTDVRLSDWFYDYVKKAFGKQLMGGTAEGVFSPQGTATRGQIVQILYNAAGQPAVDEVKVEGWYGKAATWAMEKGVVAGFPDGDFHGDDSVTREQLATILWAYEGAPKQEGALLFADADKIHDYAKDALLWAKKEGIIGGKPGNLADPQGTATRAEIATIFSNYMK